MNPVSVVVNFPIMGTVVQLWIGPLPPNAVRLLGDGNRDRAEQPLLDSFNRLIFWGSEISGWIPAQRLAGTSAASWLESDGTVPGCK